MNNDKEAKMEPKPIDTIDDSSTPDSEEIKKRNRTILQIKAVNYHLKSIKIKEPLVEALITIKK